MRKGQARFAALLSGHGVHVVAYEATKAGYSVTTIGSYSGPLFDVEEAAQRLAATLSAYGARGGDLALLVHGLASNYEKLALPPAAPAVLESVIQREMLRLSGLPDGVVAHMMNEPEPGSAAVKREVWAGAISSRLRDLLVEQLAGVNIAVKHIAVLPGALATLYSQFAHGPDDGALMICLDEGPVSAFFHGGQLRLILESPVGQGDEADYAAVCAEQFGRGALFLRQQFRGASPDALLLAASPRIWNDVSAELRASQEVNVSPVGDAREPVASLLALGAAIDATAHPAMNLARTATRRRVRRGSVLHKLVFASQLLVVTATLFALIQLARLTRAENSLKQRDEAAWRYQRELATMVSTAGGRASEHRNVEALQEVLQQNGSLQTVLSSLAAATPHGVELDSMTVTRGAGGWQGTIFGRTLSQSNAESVRQLSQFYRNLTQESSIRSAEVEDFSYMQAQDALASPFGVRFKIVFTSQVGA